MTNWTKQAKTIITLTKQGFRHLGRGFLLTEQGGYLLQEDTFRILLQGYDLTKDSRLAPAYSKDSKHQPTLTKQDKSQPTWIKEEK
jgi:hypothetical protein